MTIDRITSNQYSDAISVSTNKNGHAVNGDGFLSNISARLSVNNPENSIVANTGKVKPPLMPYAGKHSVKITNEYFAMAHDGVISYNGTTFICDKDANALTVGNVSDRNKCISVGLSKGGSLIFNRDDTDGVMNAITMFSPEDQERIMKAIQMDNMSQKALKDIEDLKNSDNIKSTDSAKEIERQANEY